MRLDRPTAWHLRTQSLPSSGRQLPKSKLSRTITSLRAFGYQFDNIAQGQRYQPVTTVQCLHELDHPTLIPAALIILTTQALVYFSSMCQFTQYAKLELSNYQSNLKILILLFSLYILFKNKLLLTLKYSHHLQESECLAGQFVTPTLPQ